MDNFLIGMASVLDIGGTLLNPKLPKVKTHEEAIKTDAEAIRGDWEKVCSRQD